MPPIRSPASRCIIEYGIALDGQVSELFCLATALIEHEDWPIEFPDRYHEHWELETAIGDLPQD